MNTWPGPITRCDLGPQEIPPEWWDEYEWNALESAMDASRQSHRISQGHDMPNISSMMPSKYLKKEDVPQPALVTIRSFSHDNVAAQGQPEEKKWVMHFNEFENGMVMNPTNLQLCAIALGSEETEDWIGCQVVLYNDPNVSYAGRLTGGIRIRQVRVRQPAPVAQAAPRQAAPPLRQMTQPAAAPVAFSDMDDDVPF